LGQIPHKEPLRTEEGLTQHLIVLQNNNVKALKEAQCTDYNQRSL